MKVLQIGKYFYPHFGGIETFLYDLCDELKDKVELKVVVANEKFKTEKEIINGIEVNRIGKVIKIASTSICPLFPYYIGKYKPDVVHIHFPNPLGEISYFLSNVSMKSRGNKSSGCKLIVSYHSDIVKQKSLLKIYTPLIEKLLKRADCIIVHSENYMRSSPFLKNYQLKCRVVPIGIDIRKFSITDNTKIIMERIKQKVSSRFILFIGRLVYYKGLPYLIDAMTDVDTQLVVIGSGPLEKELKKKVSRKFLNDKILFTGRVSEEEKIAYLHLCELLVLPSIERSEAYGIVQLEAMVCGKPVVSSCIPGSGISFVNKDNITGLLVPPGNSKALSESINYLLNNDELRNTLGKQAKERVIKEFSKKVVGEKIFRIYKDLRD